MERIAKQEKCVIYLSMRLTSSLAASGHQLRVVIRGCATGACSRLRGVGYTFNFGPEIEKMPNLMERAHFFSCAQGGRNAHGPDDSPKYYTRDALT
ncbi:hypothetical protein EDB83DRAFT_392867 [Lactarius deliciosus]|nr:hypothetical protein EDB83DRAFT_392867 [Lactarius deliciosus]